MKLSNIFILASALPAFAAPAAPDAAAPAVVGRDAAPLGSRDAAPVVLVDGGSSAPSKRESGLEQSIDELFTYLNQNYPELHLADREVNAHAKRGIPIDKIIEVIRCIVSIFFKSSDGSPVNVNLNDAHVNDMVNDIADKVSQILGNHPN